MKLSREPVVWRTALAGIIAALVTLGVLTGPAADEVNGGLDALLVAVNALLPIVAGLLARAKVAPTTAAAGTETLVLDEDGVYRPATAGQTAHLGPFNGPAEQQPRGMFDA